MSFEEIDGVDEIYERRPRKQLAVQEAAEMLGVRAHTLRYGSARYETEGLDPVEPTWARTVPLYAVLEIQGLR